MTDRDLRQLLQSMERLINTARYQHGLVLTVRGLSWEGHSALTQAGERDDICESCGNINQAEYELATSLRYVRASPPR